MQNGREEKPTKKKDVIERSVLQLKTMFRLFHKPKEISIKQISVCPTKLALCPEIVAPCPIIIAHNIRAFQNIRSFVTVSKSTSPVFISHNAFKDHRGDVTTGVTARAVRGVGGEWAGNDTTRPATQVGPRAVEAGLGGQDDGASGVDEGAERASL